MKRIKLTSAEIQYRRNIGLSSRWKMTQSNRVIWKISEKCYYSWFVSSVNELDDFILYQRKSLMNHIMSNVQNMRNCTSVIIQWKRYVPLLTGIFLRGLSFEITGFFSQIFCTHIHSTAFYPFAVLSLTANKGFNLNEFLDKKSHSLNYECQ